MSDNVSLPAADKAPRELTHEERVVLARVADTLIPARADVSPAASAEPGFWESLDVALDARADAFDEVTRVLGELRSVEPSGLWERLRTLDVTTPAVFQALSTVIAGAWLLTPGARDRIGYHGQQSDKAGLEEAADEVSSGVLDAVLRRGVPEGPRWIR
jgi:hypothetical protein